MQEIKWSLSIEQRQKAQKTINNKLYIGVTAACEQSLLPLNRKNCLKRFVLDVTIRFIGFAHLFQASEQKKTTDKYGGRNLTSVS